MAIYGCRVKMIGRSGGHSAVAAAAYRARAELTDARTGQRYDYTKAYGGGDLAFAGIFAPKDAPEWATERGELWNHVEAFENRSNSQLAREFQVDLPHELTEEQNRWLVQDFCKELTRKGLVADVAIHRPHEWGDERNIHAHILVTTRALEGDDFASHKDRSLNTTEQLEEWRADWAKQLARHLERHGFTLEAERMAVGHLTLKAQHIEAIKRADLEWAAQLDKEPQVHFGKAAAAMERQGLDTDKGDINRAIAAVNEDRAQERHEAAPQSQPEPQEQKRAAEIRQAWEQAEGDAVQFGVNLGQAGYTLAVSKYGHFVAVDAQGDIHRFTRATLQGEAGAARQALAERFAPGSEIELPRVDEIRAEIREQKRERERAEWLEAKRQERAASLADLSDVQTLRRVWTQADTAATFASAVEAYGFVVARADEQDALESKHRAAVAKSHSPDYFVPSYKEGELVAFNARGAAYRLDGATLDDIQASMRLGAFAAPLPTLDAAKQIVSDRMDAEARPEPLQPGRLPSISEAPDKAAAVAAHGLEGVARGIESAVSGLGGFLFGSSEPAQAPSAPTAVYAPEPKPEPPQPRQVREAAKRAEKAGGVSYDDAYARYVASHAQHLDPEIIEAARRMREQQEREERERDRGRDRER